MGRWGAERARGKKTSSHSAGIRQEEEDRCLLAISTKKAKRGFIPSTLSPNSWINLEANRLPDVPALRCSFRCDSDGHHCECQ